MENNLLNIGFLCSADFGLDILKFIIEKKLANVHCVWSNPDKRRGRSQKIQSNQIVTYCRSEKIPCYQPNNFKEEKQQQINNVKKHNVDLLFVIAYGHILPSDFFQAAKHQSINIHFSLLPKYRGASPIQSCILAGEEKTGITIQKIIQKLDAGNIVLQEEFLIKNLNALEVFQESLEVTKKITKKFFSNAISFLENSYTQQNSQATFCYKIKKEDGFISNQDTFENVKNKFLAYYLWPKIFFIINEISYQIEEINLNFDNAVFQNTTTDKNLANGHLHFIEKKLLLILKGGAIEITKIKKSGKKTMSAVDFINGCKFSLPVRIGSKI